MVLTESQSKQYLIYKLGGYLFGSAISNIKRILPLEKVYKVPLAKINFEGIFNYEGRPVPLFNLEKAMGLKKNKLSDDRLVAVEQIAGKDIGILIGDVLTVARFEPETFEDYDGEMAYIDKKTVWEGNEVFLMNSEKLI